MTHNPKKVSLFESANIRLKKIEWLNIFILAVLVSIVFWPARNFSFLLWDDDIHISENPLLGPITTQSFIYFISKPFFGLYIPITYLFWSGLAAIQQLLFSATSLTPFLFHISNIILHLLNTFLVYFLLRRLIPEKKAALIGAAFFGIHPIQIESVAWISGAKDLLAVFFSLLALLTIIPSNSKVVGWKHILIGYFSYVFALGSKPSAVVLPFSLFCLLKIKKNAENQKKFYLIYISWILLAVPISILTENLQSSDINKLPKLSIFQRLLVASDTILFYVQKIIIPFPQIVDYGRIPTKALSLSSTPIAIVTIFFLILYLALTKKKYWSAVHWAILSVFFWLLPNLGLVPFGYQMISTVADRYAYAPMIGIATIIGLCCEFLSKKKQILTIASIFLISILVFVSSQYVKVFQNTETLFTHVLRFNPNSVSALNNLGVINLQRGNIEPGAAYLEAAALLSPLSFKTIDNIGVARQMQKRANDAIEYHQRAIRIEPRYGTAYVNLADALRDLQQLEAAEKVYLEALRVEPRNYLANNNFGVFLETNGRPGEAEKFYLQAAKLSTFPFLAYYNLGILYEKNGKHFQANQSYQAALQLDPGSKIARDAFTRTKQSP